MKTQYYTASSLDEFIATEDDSLEWLFSLGSLSDTSYPEFIAEVGALAMGSATYEWMMRNADRVAADTGSPWPYSQPVWVFTRRKLASVPGADIRFAAGDLVSARQMGPGFAELRYEVMSRAPGRAAEASQAMAGPTS